MATVSVMVYFTPEFKNYACDPKYFIKRQMAAANVVMLTNKIPVRFYIFCIEELEGFQEHHDEKERLIQFQRAKTSLASSSDCISTLLNTADIAILMTGTAAKSGVRGVSRGGPPNTLRPPLAWVFPQNDFTFVHEIGHIFGCHHNREDHKTGDGGQEGQSNHGYHMKGSNMCTIMAYPNSTYPKNTMWFSSKDLTYKGVPLGDSQHDNRSQMIKTRFLISQLGDESGSCHHRKFDEDNCPVFKGKGDAYQDCKHCCKTIDTPMKDHLVRTDPDWPRTETCKTVLNEIDHLKSYKCGEKIDPTDYDEHCEKEN